MKLIINSRLHLLKYGAPLCHATPLPIYRVFKSAVTVYAGKKYKSVSIFNLDAGMLARSRYPEGPATGHLDTGFSWFPCV